jgi:hypothetical protein
MLAMLCSTVAMSADAARAATTPVTITPSRGLPHSMVIIQGKGFTPNTAGNVTIVSIEFGGVEATDFFGNIDSVGRLTAACKVPAVKGGTRLVAITDNGGVTKSTTWTIPKPKLKLTKSMAYIGASFAVNGTNFVPSETAIITLAGTTRTTTVSTAGKFSYQITVPTTIAGSHKVTATDTTGNKAEAPFTVLASVISVTPDSGRLGSQVAVNGTGFPAYSIVRVDFVTAFTGIVDVTPVPTPVVGPDGKVTANFGVPSGFDGDAIVILTAGGISAATTFYVLAPATPTPSPTPVHAVTVSPHGGYPGSEVEVSGTGFPASSIVQVLFIRSVGGTADVTALPGPKIGPNGDVTTTIIVPASPPGAAYVLVSAGGLSAGAGFTVDESPTPTASPTHTPGATPTPTPLSTPTPTSTPSPEPTPTPTPWPTRPPEPTAMPPTTPPPYPTATPVDESGDRHLTIPWWTIGLITGAMLVVGPLFYGLRLRK